MSTQKSDNEARIKLSEFTKIPAKEFEQQFRDWMERDDVARSLQAKLRADLISNFNKTALGKQILAYTTTTTTGGYGAGSQRLTLSPLTLALNTLVAEFLYAENCHFSLSVFCTEVPFRNTLPDFECMRHFRFTDAEIAEIFAAVTSGCLATNVAPLLTKDITRHYVEDGGGRISLLLAILKVFLEMMSKRDEQTLKHPPKPAEPEAPPPIAAVTNDGQQDFKGEENNTHFRYLNKYLIILSKKVNEMTQQFKSLQQASQTQRRGPARVPTRLPKTTRSRRFENLNRSLEKITENLKQISHAKQRSKQVAAIVSAIEGLAQQFAKCAANFKYVSNGIGSNMSQTPSVSARPVGVEKQTETDKERKVEKTYMDWVQEMRHTANGQKFLNKIELALQKALRNQRDQLSNEVELKLRHQKELLKIRYKQKLMQHITKHSSNTDNTDAARKINENIEQQLRQFEAKHLDLLQKIRETEAEAKRELPRREVHVEKFVEVIRQKVPDDQSRHEVLQPVPQTLAQPQQPPVLDGQPPTTKLLAKTVENPSMTEAINKQRELQQMLMNMVEQERTADYIVYDAKLRMQELESESNQIEQSFLNYLERQKQRKEATQKAAAKVWHNYEKDRQEMLRRYKGEGHITLGSNKISTCIESSRENSEDAMEAVEPFKTVSDIKDREPPSKPDTHRSNDTTELQCRNAIREAKDNFFEQRRRQFENVERELINIPALNLDEEKSHSGTEDWRTLVVPQKPKSPQPAELAMQFLFPPSLAQLDGPASGSNLFAQLDLKPSSSSSSDGACNQPKQTPTEPARESYAPPYQSRPLPLKADTASAFAKCKRELFANDPGNNNSDAPHHCPAAKSNNSQAMALQRGQLHSTKSNQPRQSKQSAVTAATAAAAATANESKATAIKNGDDAQGKQREPPASSSKRAAVLQQSMAKMQQLFGQVAVETGLTAATDDGSEDVEVGEENGNKEENYRTAEAEATSCELQSRQRPQPEPREISGTRGTLTTNEAEAATSRVIADALSAKLTGTSILSATTAPSTSPSTVAEPMASAMLDAEQRRLAESLTTASSSSSSSSESVERATDANSSAISLDVAAVLRADNLCAQQKTASLKEPSFAEYEELGEIPERLIAGGGGAAPVTADTQEIGELNESGSARDKAVSIAAALAVIQQNLRSPVVSPAISSTSYSSELKLSTGGGDGQQASDSGSDFWQ